MALKQYTIAVEGFVTVVAEEGLEMDDVRVKLDVFTQDEISDTAVTEVNETEVTGKSVISKVDL